MRIVYDIDNMEDYCRANKRIRSVTKHYNLEYTIKTTFDEYNDTRMYLTCKVMESSMLAYKLRTGWGWSALSHSFTSFNDSNMGVSGYEN